MAASADQHGAILGGAGLRLPISRRRDGAVRPTRFLELFDEENVRPSRLNHDMLLFVRQAPFYSSDSYRVDPHLILQQFLASVVAPLAIVAAVGT